MNFINKHNYRMQSLLYDSNRVRNGDIYYYLPLGIFIKNVVSSEHPDVLILRLSHIDNLSDCSEFSLGQDIIESHPILDGAYPLTNGAIKKKFPLQISFSHSKDCFPMWEIYGKKFVADIPKEIPRCGVMLAFDRIELERYFQNIHRYTGIYDCIYSGTKRYYEIKKMFLTGQLTDTNGIPVNMEANYLIHRLPFIAKDGHYKYENEIRVVNIPTEDPEQRIYSSDGYYYVKIPKAVLRYVMIFPHIDENERESSYKLVEEAYNRCISNDIPSSKIIFSKILARK